MSKSPALRRIQADIRELTLDPSDRYHAQPLENDMFEWHFTIRGADGTDFEGGYYHGRILLPAEYPFKPPNIVFLTPSGRFETNTKVCLSFSAYHPELWQPAWGIRLILEALVSFLPTKGDGAIGALDWTSEERKRLAKKSVNYTCPVCGKCSDVFKVIEKKLKSKKKAALVSGCKYQKEIEHLMGMQMANHDGDTKEQKDGDGDAEGNANAESGEGEQTEEGVIVEPEDAVPKEEEEEEEEEDGQVEDSKPTATGSVQPDVEIDQDGNDTTAPTTDGIESSTIRRELKLPETDEPFVEMESSNKTQTEAESKGGVDIPNDDNAGSTNVSSPPAAAQDNRMDDEELLEPLEEPELLHSPLLSDPVVHSGIVIFSFIVWILVRKLSAIIEDMKELEAEMQQFK